MFWRSAFAAYLAPPDDNGAEIVEEGPDSVEDDVLAAIKELRCELSPAAQPEAGAEAAFHDQPPALNEGRDDRGRFAPKQDKNPQAQIANQAQSKALSTQQPATNQQTQTPSQPPAWLSPAGKAKWANVPNDVKADIGRMEQQATVGLEASRQFADIKPFADLAERQGIRLADALTQYRGIEELISRDIESGFLVICRNKGLNQQQAALVFANLAAKLGANPGQRSNGHAQPGAQPQTDPNDPLIELMQPFLGPLHEKLQSMQSELSGWKSSHEEAQIGSIVNEIEKFASHPENIYYAEVEPYIQQLFTSGIVKLTGNHAADLQSAYNMAVRMHPQVFAAWNEQQREAKEAERRQKEQEAADKARKASRSMGGSRIPGVAKQPAQSANQDDVMADVMAAYNSVKSA